MAMPVEESSVSPTACQIRAALEQVTASSTFRKSGQLASFLRFAVQETLAGRGDRIKAYTIATAALGRDDNFDPQLDPIVRVEAGRLRRALRQYYAAEGHDDPIVIDLPVGRYTPVFRRNSGRGQAAAPARRLWHQLADAIQQHRTLLLLIVVVAAVVSLSVDMLEMLFAKTVWPMLQHLARAVSAILWRSFSNGAGH
jgi:hypothetical protein